MSLPNAKSRAARMIAQHESFTPHMYLDSVSYVTVGIGKMIPTTASTASINFMKVTVRPLRVASATEKAAEWHIM